MSDETFVVEAYSVNKSDTRRRAGFDIPSRPAKGEPFATFEVTAEQLAEMKDDPMVVIESVKPVAGEVKTLNVTATAELIKAASTLEELEALGLSKDTRKGVIDALAARKAELEG